MHTLAKNEHHNARLIHDFIKRAYPNGKPSFDQLVKDNIINGTQLLELAVSKVDDIPLCPVGYNRDLIDDSDVKTVTVREAKSIRRATLVSGRRRRYKSTSYIAAIQRVDKKFGVLRVICFNPFLDKYHYFLIPPSASFSTSTVTITFDPTTKLPGGKYAPFEVASFEEMSKVLSVRDEIDTIVCNIDKDNIQEQIDKLLNIVQNGSAHFTTGASTEPQRPQQA